MLDVGNSNVSSNNSAGITDERLEVGWKKILIATLLFLVTFATIFGNVLVLVAVKTEKKLRTAFNYYIVNLAITDVGVAVTAMSFMATHTVLGYWPFGEFLCAVWIFFDYGMTFVSVFTLILISLDRFWSVTWSLNYRRYHTKKKSIIAIVAIWLFMLALWIPPWLLDRIRHSQPGVCYWDPSLNEEFVYIVAVLGHHGPYCIIVACYIHICYFVHKRSKVAMETGIIRSTMHASSISTTRIDIQPRNEASHSNTTTEVVSFSKPSKQNQMEVPHTSNARLNVPQAQRYSNSNAQVESRATREKRIFVTLTYILVAYGILWLPFHIVFDISIVDPMRVPESVLNLSFWMAYFNSTINPILYNFSSPEFKRVFKRMFQKMRFCK